MNSVVIKSKELLEEMALFLVRPIVTERGKFNDITG